MKVTTVWWGSVERRNILRQSKIFHVRSAQFVRFRNYFKIIFNYTNNLRIFFSDIIAVMI